MIKFFLTEKWRFEYYNRRRAKNIKYTFNMALGQQLHLSFDYLRLNLLPRIHHHPHTHHQ